MTTALAKSDEPEAAEEYLKRLLAHMDERSGSYAGLVLINELTGEREKALHSVDVALEKGGNVDRFEGNPWLAELLADPEYQARVAAINR